MEELIRTVLIMVQVTISFFGVITLIDLVFNGKSSVGFYRSYWKRFKANAWLKEENSNQLIPVKVIARTEDEKFLLVLDWDEDVRLEPIQNVVVPLDKELVIKAARISNI